MSNCDVCFYVDVDSMAEFYSDSFPKARKPFRCCECRREFPKGTTYHKATGKWEGELQTFKTCTICHEIRQAFGCDGQWQFETLWENMQDYSFEKLTTASDCFKACSPEAKQYVLDRWKKWKF